jgi:uncharacterized protein YfkK (UPF0435 family)
MEISDDNINCLGELNLAVLNPLKEFFERIDLNKDYTYDEEDFKQKLQVINALEQLVLHPESLHADDRNRLSEIYKEMCNDNDSIKQLEELKQTIQNIVPKDNTKFVKIAVNKLERINQAIFLKCSNPGWEKKIWTGQNQDHGKTYYEKIGNANTWQWEVPQQGGRRYKHKTKRRHTKLKRTKRRHTKSHRRR